VPTGYFAIDSSFKMSYVRPAPQGASHQVGNQQSAVRGNRGDVAFSQNKVKTRTKMGFDQSVTGRSNGS